MNLNCARKKNFRVEARGFFERPRVEAPLGSLDIRAQPCGDKKDAAGSLAG